MINILYEPFPDTIEADGVRYSIVTDFREWLKYADLCADKTLPDGVKLYLLLQWVDEPPAQVTAAFLDALHAFYVAEELEYPSTACGGPPPLSGEAWGTACHFPTHGETPLSGEANENIDAVAPRPPCFDWCIDARYILGDFRRYYGIDLLHVDYLHWWAFKSLFYALPDDSMCMKRVSLRATDY